MKMNMPTRPSSRPVPRQLEIIRLPDTPKLKLATISPPPLPAELSQSLLMPATGLDTPAEFSITAEPDSTTVSPSSESMQETGGSRTLGEPPGERRASSDSLPETPAVSATWPHSLNDLEPTKILIHHINKTMLVITES